MVPKGFETSSDDLLKQIGNQVSDESELFEEHAGQVAPSAADITDT